MIRTVDRGGVLRGVTLVLAMAAASMLLFAFACSGTGGTGEFATSGAGGSDTSATASGTGGSVFVGSGGMTPGNALIVKPSKPTLMVNVPIMQPATIQFSCLDSMTNMPVAAPTWTIDTPSIGTLDVNGLFTATGTQAGPAKVQCAAGGRTGETTLTVHIHAVETTGTISPGDIATLQGPPGQSDASWQFLYPYDKTVFPRGTVPPEVQLTDGASAGNEFYVHINTPTYEYEGFFATGSPVRLNMSQGAWDGLTNSAGGQNVDVNISKLAGGVKYGPIFRTWTLAPGKLHGVVYYNTYDSMIAAGGAMMMVKGTSTLPNVLVGNCTVCHSISSDGSTGAAANHSGQGGIFDLSGGMAPPPVVYQTPEDAAFAGLFPKGGTVWVKNAAPGGSYPPNTPGTIGTWTSSLYTRTGTPIPGSGIDSYYAQSPIFSHDGTKLAFVDRTPSPPYPSKLAMMDYDANAQKFSNYQVLATPPAGRHYSWGAFTPDSKFLFYQDGTGDDLATWSGNTAKLWFVDTQTKTTTYLPMANGDGYVPQPGRDENKDYEPTFAPIASGGYFWLMFTSRRTYGNELTGAESQTKRLWVSAIDINIQDGMDPSHPAFYVPGQEITSGNSRGFWALDACKADGQTCQTGDECCNGFCEPKGNPPMFECGPPNGMCAHEFESCTMDSDCCDATLTCIGGKCTYVPPK